MLSLAYCYIHVIFQTSYEELAVYFEPHRRAPQEGKQTLPTTSAVSNGARHSSRTG